MKSDLNAKINYEKSIFSHLDLEKGFINDFDVLKIVADFRAASPDLKALVVCFEFSHQSPREILGKRAHSGKEKLINRKPI